MSRPRYRACLEQGLRLDLNRLARQGFVLRGGRSGPKGIRWSYTYTDEHIASGTIEAGMGYPPEGWFRIRVGSLNQMLDLVAQPRRFGGYQWYFRCPRTHRLASVMWMPVGGRTFASRQAWGRQVAYASQFETWHGRALTMAHELRTKLGGPEYAGIGNGDPPKPKWMRWATYNRIMDRADRYEGIADQRLIMYAAQFLKK